MADFKLSQAEQDRARRGGTERSAQIARLEAPDHPLHRLQRQIGNAEVARMLAQREDEGLEDEDQEIEAKHDPALAQRAGEEEEMLQGKHDPALAQRVGEEEEMLQGKHDPALAQRVGEEDEMLQGKHDSALAQRAAPEEEEMLQGKHDSALAQRAGEEDEMLQGKHDLSRAAVEEAPRVGLEGGPVDSEIQSRIESQRGGGSPLSGDVRSHMEGAFGTSFENVRVHTGGEADSLNRSITARAFTTGSDIFLRSDANPGDRSLLAHELTHVVQQGSGSVGGGGGGMQVGAAGDQSEQEADAVAAQVTSGSPQRLSEEIGH